MTTELRRPQRGSFHHRVYVDLVCGMKAREKRRILVSRIADARGMRRVQVMYIYDRYVRPQLRAGTRIAGLV